LVLAVSDGAGYEVDDYQDAYGYHSYEGEAAAAASFAEY